MALSREAVIWGFRFILGREPESEAVIEAHTAARDHEHLAQLLLRSPEFTSGKRLRHLPRTKAAGVPAAGGSVPGTPISTSNARVLLLGNCQVRPLARLMQAMTGTMQATAVDLPTKLAQFRADPSALRELLAASDLVFAQSFSEQIELITTTLPAVEQKLRIIPRLAFAGFHPDAVYVRDQRGTIAGPMDEYQSALAYYGWTRGLSITETVDLFCDEVFERLGYYDYWDTARTLILGEGARAGLPLDELMERWARTGVWMHTMNHPKHRVLADVARAILHREGIDAIKDAEQFVPDEFARSVAWPVYPEIAQRLGLEGGYRFKALVAGNSLEAPVLMLSLEEFIRGSFEVYARYSAGELQCERLESARFQALDAQLASVRSAAGRAGPGGNDVSPDGTGHKPRHPYEGLPDHHFWRRAVEAPAMAEVDPVTMPSFAVAKTDQVATAGSCFAQHLSRTLTSHGFTYFVAEDGAGLPAEEARLRNYGVFSARFGNLYTARQLLQLFDRAYGQFRPIDEVWRRPDGRLVDPFRPQIEPEGYTSAEALEASRAEHFAAVRTMLETLDVLVFTFGLTESWRSRADGAIFPLAPGVAGGDMDPERYEFVNFTVADVVNDMRCFIARLRNVNPRARLLLTVSPVPLVATYERRHVLVSNTYSKAVLRAAAGEICRAHALCDYFPSFEIITGNHARGSYFDADLRSVRPEGVEHVMRVFMRHYSRAPAAGHDSDLARELTALNDVVCDEEALDTQRRSAVSAA